MELTAFPSDFGNTTHDVAMQGWDIVIKMDDKFSEMFAHVQEAYGTLPDAPLGYKWELVTHEDEPIYNRTDKELSLHFSLVKE